MEKSMQFLGKVKAANRSPKKVHKNPPSIIVGNSCTTVVAQFGSCAPSSARFQKPKVQFSFFGWADEWRNFHAIAAKNRALFFSRPN
jgi:hypothetical protein